MPDKRHVSSVAVYHIQVKGELDEKWAKWFEGFAMTSCESGRTLLSGAVADQAELFGILGKINSLGLSLLLVARANCSCPGENCASCG